MALLPHRHIDRTAAARWQLFNAIDLRRKLVRFERHAQQELHPGHDPIAIGDARSALDQAPPEQVHVVRNGGVQ